MRHLAPIRFLALAGLLLAGCSASRSGWSTRVPRAADRFAQGFIELLLKEEFAEARERVGLPLRPEDLAPDKAPASLLLGKGEPQNTQMVSSHEIVLGTTRRANLTYQIQYAQEWVVVTVDVETKEDESRVVNLQASKLFTPLDEQNRFTFGGWAFNQWVMFLIACAVAIFSLAALVVCLFTRTPRKLLWMLFVLTGLSSVRFNWTTGERVYEWLSIQFPCVLPRRASPYDPWVLSIGLPVGAALFFLYRRRLKKAGPAEEPPEEEPAPTEPPPAPEPDFGPEPEPIKIAEYESPPEPKPQADATDESAATDESEEDVHAPPSDEKTV